MGGARLKDQLGSVPTIRGTSNRRELTKSVPCVRHEISDQPLNRTSTSHGSSRRIVWALLDDGRPLTYTIGMFEQCLQLTKVAVHMLDHKSSNHALLQLQRGV